jgi:hypothetical protein
MTFFSMAKELFRVIEKQGQDSEKGEAQGCHLSIMYLGISELSRGPT